MFDACTAAQLAYNEIIRSTNASVAEQFVLEVVMFNYMYDMNKLL